MPAKDDFLREASLMLVWDGELGERGGRILPRRAMFLLGMLMIGIVPAIFLSFHS